MRTKTRGSWGERGSAIVEFVIILPALLLVMFGTIELSRLWMTLSVAAEATREAARMGAVSTPTFSNTAAIARINQILATVGATAASAPTVTCPSPCNTGATVTANVTVNFSTSIPLLVPVFGETIAVQQTAQMRRE